MNALTIAFGTLLAAALLLQAGAAALRHPSLARIAAPPLQSARGRILMAAFLLLAGLAAAAGTAVPFVTFFGGVLGLLASMMLMLRAMRTRQALPVLIAIAMACLALASAAVQPLGLKVLALPKADDLPFVPVPARVVKTYDEGLWFEGIAAASDGTLYLAGNRGIDFSRKDYYAKAQGEVIEHRPDGAERVIFRTPRGSAAGVMAMAGDGSLYMASHGSAPAIWRIGLDGQGQRVAQLPTGAWPNGLAVGPDGLLYSPDSALGLVWRIAPSTGRIERAVEDQRLLARAWIALAPGANGLHFLGRDMYVTVSDRTTVLKYSLQEAGRFAPPTVVATGIPGDDFAIGADGSLFITTHPYNTVVRVSATGERTIVASQEQHIVGATDAVFGTGKDDRDTLYVVTDGGAFTGGPRTRGALVALHPYAQAH